MAKILFAAGIEEVSGALSKVNRKSMHVDDQNMFLATHRKAETMTKGCQRAYYRKTNSLPWYNGIANTSAENVNKVVLLRREFGIKGTAVATRRKDLSAISADTMNFLAYREKHPNATLKYFMWLGAQKYYDAETETVNWPASGGIVIDD